MGLLIFKPFYNSGLSCPHHSCGQGSVNLGKFDSLPSLSSRIAPRAIPRPQSSKQFLDLCLTVLPAAFPHGSTVPGAAWVFFSHCFHHSLLHPPPAQLWDVDPCRKLHLLSCSGSTFPLTLSMESSPVPLSASQMMFWARTPARSGVIPF